MQTMTALQMIPIHAIWNEPSNWKNCIDGDCLWFDGSDDYAKVNVDDWLVISQLANGFGEYNKPI